MNLIVRQTHVTFRHFRGQGTGVNYFRCMGGNGTGKDKQLHQVENSPLGLTTFFTKKLFRNTVEKTLKPQIDMYRVITSIASPPLTPSPHPSRNRAHLEAVFSPPVLVPTVSVHITGMECLRGARYACAPPQLHPPPPPSLRTRIICTDHQY